MSNPEIDTAGTETSTASKATIGTVRKRMKDRSGVWDHFLKIETESGLQAKCKYCAIQYKYNSKRNGTSTLWAHISKCRKYPYNVPKDSKSKQSLLSFQALQFMLADHATEIEAARQLVYTSARAVDAGVKSFSKISAMAKLFASDVAMKVTTDAVQIFGGYGYCRDYPIEKYMRDAKITQIYEGTNQIQRLVVARNLIKELASQSG